MGLDELCQPGRVHASSGSEVLHEGRLQQVSESRCLRHVGLQEFASSSTNVAGLLRTINWVDKNLWLDDKSWQEVWCREALDAYPDEVLSLRYIQGCGSGILR